MYEIYEIKYEIHFLNIRAIHNASSTHEFFQNLKLYARRLFPLANRLYGKAWDGGICLIIVSL